MANQLIELTLRCIVCGEAIPKTRAMRKSVTCSEEHHKTLLLYRRQLRDLNFCRLCCRPSTPAQRANFAAWNRSKGTKRGPKPKMPREET